MNSTLAGPVPPYVSADLTDRYAYGCRPIDLCGLTPEGAGRLAPKFWTWRWDRGPGALRVGPIVAEARGAKYTLLDGPQEVARVGRTMRQADREAAAAAKVPDHRPTRDRPFGGYVCSSLDLFQALADAGIDIGKPGDGALVGEVYPGHAWPLLAGETLPKKSSAAGIEARVRLLQTLGVYGFPAHPTHDQLDAALGALLAAASCGAVSGLQVAWIGEPLFRDDTGTLREGEMLIPARSGASGAAQAIPEHVAGESEWSVSSMSPDEPLQRGAELLTWFMKQATSGEAHLCSYAWAHACLFGWHPEPWSQAYTTRVLEIATAVRPKQLEILGEVRLDSFIVRKRDGEPGAGHWRSAPYTADRWRAVLKGAHLLH